MMIFILQKKKNGATTLPATTALKLPRTSRPLGAVCELWGRPAGQDFCQLLRPRVFLSWPLAHNRAQTRLKKSELAGRCESEAKSANYTEIELIIWGLWEVGIVLSWYFLCTHMQ